MPESPQLKQMEYAHKCIQHWPSDSRKQLTVASKGLPVMLRSQGVAVAVATLNKERKTQPLAENIARWLLEDAPVKTLKPDESRRAAPVRKLLAACAKVDRTAYRVAQREALALAEMIKIYAEAWENGEK